MSRALLLPFLVLVASTFLSADEGGMPQIVCRSGRGQAFPLELAAFHLQVERHADVAETTITLSFRNSTNRNLEGDFSLPLPAGANVTNYALEVNGEMREAVAVAKERARLAYETIKGQNIDPGIVEREAGNVYRTRIFPILRHSTKTLRISYMEFLRVDGPAPFRPRWSFPFHLTSPVDNFSVTVLNAGDDTISHDSLIFEKDESGHQVAKLKNATLTGTLTVEATEPHRPTRLVGEGGKNNTSYLTLNRSDYPDVATNSKVPLPPQVNLVWDCSRSMRETDFTESYAFLNEFIKTAGLTKITLYLASTITEEVGSYAVKGGDWSKVREILEKQESNGASHFRDLPDITTTDSLTLLITDGQGTSLPKAPKLAGRLIVLTPQAAPRASYWEQVARRSGGSCVALEGLTAVEAVRKALKREYSLTTSSGGCEFIGLPSARPFVERSLMDFPNNSPARLRLQASPRESFRLQVETKTVPARFLERLYGLGKLWELEARKAPQREIIAHCKEHGLVSDYTSLIVLERMEDHLRFQIPPPEAELLQSYHAQLKTLKGEPARNFSSAWSDYLASYRHRYPWLDVVIAEDLKRISIWNRAQAQVFTPEELPLSARKPTLEWEKKARELLSKKKSVKTSGKLDEWKEDFNELAKEALDLTNAPPQEEERISVSVQGLVRKPGIITSRKTLSLETAVTEAGGPYLYGSREAVTLYRGSQKTTYNLLSKAYQDVPLRSGDMVVLPNHDPWERDGCWDPFASSDPFVAGGRALQAAADRPAVVEDSSRSLDLEAFSAGNRFQNRTGKAALKEADERVLAGPDPMTFVSLALELHEKGQNKEAHRTLSNLSELFQEKASVTRLHALALYQLGNTGEAKALLHDLLERLPHDHVASKLLAEISLVEGATDDAIVGYQNYFENYSQLCDSDAGLILLTHHNQITRGVASERISHRDQLPCDLVVTICNPSPDRTTSISLQDPSGRRVATGGFISPTGVTSISSFGLDKFFDREALPGDYSLSLTSQQSQLLLVTTQLYTGQEREVISREVVLVTGTSPYQLTIPFSLPTSN